MSFLRVLATTAVVACIALTATMPAADAHRHRSPTLDCGTLPTTDVVLRGDLTCATGFHFPPGSPGVAIDLGGHTLTVPGDAGRCTAPGPCGAIAGAAAVRNGGVVGTLTDIGEVRSVLVVGSIEVGPGFSGAPGPASVRRSIVLDGDVRIWAPDVTVEANIIRGSVELVSTERAVRDVSIERNWIVRSPRAGVSVAPELGAFPNDVSGRIAGNLIWGSTGAGIDIRGGVWNIGDLAIESNLLVGNGGDGFRSGTVAPGPTDPVGGPVTVTGNIAIFNAGHGFDAGWTSGVATGIVDGGTNRAAGNATDPACIGLTC